MGERKIRIQISTLLNIRNFFRRFWQYLEDSSISLFISEIPANGERFEAMAATMMRKEAANVTGVETQSSSANMKNEVQFAKCECCGLTEECTEAYIARVRERNQGRWICGLCAEAVKDEMVRSSSS